jgi:hypothetical protein
MVVQQLWLSQHRDQDQWPWIVSPPLSKVQQVHQYQYPVSPRENRLNHEEHEGHEGEPHVR